MSRLNLCVQSNLVDNPCMYACYKTNKQDYCTLFIIFTIVFLLNIGKQGGSGGRGEVGLLMARRNLFSPGESVLQQKYRETNTAINICECKEQQQTFFHFFFTFKLSYPGQHIFKDRLKRVKKVRKKLWAIIDFFFTDQTFFRPLPYTIN